jgi:cytochrome c oxidase subunit 3
MKERVVVDLAHLPLHGTGTSSLGWWGNLGYMLIEGTGFALVIAVYLYLDGIAPEWPIGAAPPDLGPGTGVLVVLLLSLLPNYMLSRWAKAADLRKVRLGILLMLAFGIAPLVIRIFEFAALNVSWDSNAYGSVLWLLLGLHTTHLLTDLVETAVLSGLMFSRHGNNKRRFGDVQNNAVYWNFIVLAWLPVYACIYLLSRL